jgi:putative sterol carrier protein
VALDRRLKGRGLRATALTVTIDDLKAIGQGKLAPMTAMVSGRLGLSDMDVAMGLQGKMQALFSRMQ